MAERAMTLSDGLATPCGEPTGRKPRRRPRSSCGHQRSARWHAAACVLYALALAGCTYSVRVLAPPDQGSPGPIQTNPVTFIVELDARADVSSFSATLDPGEPRSTDITANFSPAPTAGGQSTAVVTVPQTPCHFLGAGCLEERSLRVAAMFQTGRAFDVTGHTRRFRLQGSTTPPPPPPPPGPRIDLSLSTGNLVVIWGNAVSLTATVEGLNGFSGMVDLALENIPVGVTHAFAPASVNVPQNATATSTLTLTTAAAATTIAPPALRVRATPQASGIADRTANFNLAVQRTGGSFDPVTLRTTSTSCGSVTATVQPTGSGPGVAFSGPPFNQTNPQTLAFSAGFAISPRCRIGVVVPPVVQSTPRTGLWNLFFDPAIGAPPLGRQIDNPAGAFTNGYFSKDDSLFLLVTPNPPGSGCAEAAVARLYDVGRGTQIGSSKCYTASVVSVVLSGDTVTLNTNPPLAQPTWSVP